MNDIGIRNVPVASLPLNIQALIKGLVSRTTGKKVRTPEVVELTVTNGREVSWSVGGYGTRWDGTYSKGIVLTGGADHYMNDGGETEYRQEQMSHSACVVNRRNHGGRRPKNQVEVYLPCPNPELFAAIVGNGASSRIDFKRHGFDLGPVGVLADLLTEEGSI